MEFRISEHSLKDTSMIEVWHKGEFIAAIYSHEDGVKIVSKYLDGVTHESGTPPSTIVNFSLP